MRGHHRDVTRVAPRPRPHARTHSDQPHRIQRLPHGIPEPLTIGTHLSEKVDGADKWDQPVSEREGKEEEERSWAIARCTDRPLGQKPRKEEAEPAYQAAQCRVNPSRVEDGPRAGQEEKKPTSTALLFSFFFFSFSALTHGPRRSATAADRHVGPLTVDR